MKKNIILYIILVTIIFFSPVFAYADRIGYFLSQTPVSAPVAFFTMGAILLVAGGLTRRLIND